MKMRATNVVLPNVGIASLQESVLLLIDRIHQLPLSFDEGARACLIFGLFDLWSRTDNLPKASQNSSIKAVSFCVAADAFGEVSHLTGGHYSECNLLQVPPLHQQRFILEGWQKIASGRSRAATEAYHIYAFHPDRVTENRGRSAIPICHAGSSAIESAWEQTHPCGFEFIPSCGDRLCCWRCADHRLFSGTPHSNCVRRF